MVWSWSTFSWAGSRCPCIVTLLCMAHECAVAIHITVCNPSVSLNFSSCVTRHVSSQFFFLLILPLTCCSMHPHNSDMHAWPYCTCIIISFVPLVSILFIVHMHGKSEKIDSFCACYHSHTLLPLHAVLVERYISYHQLRNRPAIGPLTTVFRLV